MESVCRDERCVSNSSNIHLTQDNSLQQTKRVTPPTLSLYQVYEDGLDRAKDRDKPQVHGINDFIAYFECTWLGRQFAPAKWNVYSEEGPRTNSHFEGWHSKIAGKNHLNILRW